MSNEKMKKLMKQLEYKNNLRRNLNKKLEKYNYINIEPSFFEEYDSFKIFNNKTVIEETVKVINNKGEIQVLRPDITLNIMKKISELWEENLIIKLCYDSTIFKNSLYSTIKERREIGAEFLGDNSINSDLEILFIVKDILMQTKNSLLVIGNNKYIKALLEELDLSKLELDKLIYCIYKKEKKELIKILSQSEVSEEIKEKIYQLVVIEGNDVDDLKKGFQNKNMEIAIEEIEIIKNKIESNEFIKVIFDIGLVSEYSYYDGIVFNGYNLNLNKPFIKGGRYNKLSNLFNRDIPAVGFSMDFLEYYKVVGGNND